jgi:hypothetical protein
MLLTTKKERKKRIDDLIPSQTRVLRKFLKSNTSTSRDLDALLDEIDIDTIIDDFASRNVRRNF